MDLAGSEKLSSHESSSSTLGVLLAVAVAVQFVVVIIVVIVVVVVRVVAVSPQGLLGAAIDAEEQMGKKGEYGMTQACKDKQANNNNSQKGR